VFDSEKKKGSQGDFCLNRAKVPTSLNDAKGLVKKGALLWSANLPNNRLNVFHYLY